MKTRDFEKTITAVLLILVMIIGLASMVIGWGLRVLGAANAAETQTSEQQIDWAKEYPFVKEMSSETDTGNTAEAPPARRSAFVRFRNLMIKTQRLTDDMQDYVLGYRKLLELSGRVSRLLGKQDFGEASGIVQLPNGQLAAQFAYDGNDSQIQIYADNVAELARWTTAHGASFLYVQTPNKIYRHDNSEQIASNFSNEYYDDYVHALKERGIETLDLRDAMEQQKLDHYSMFYPTDVHWTLEAGRWASGVLADTLSERFGLPADSEWSNPSLYEEKVYPKHFLGYFGRTVTLGYAEPDDFTIYYPQIPTDIRMIARDRDIDCRGNVQDVMYDYDILDDENRDPYSRSSYEATAYGNRALLQVINYRADNPTKVLVIRNSFSLAMIPFFSLMVGESDWIDLRPNQGNFNGSVYSYIEKEQPDAVILLYNVEGLIY